VKRLEVAIEQGDVVLPPVVLCELLSSPRLPVSAAKLFLRLPMLEPSSGFWERAGRLRSKVLGRGLRVRLADTLIAQSCIDHHVPLITRDVDFRHFAKLGMLVLA
jgi:predicted nucleic acid-binding protein